MAVFLVAAGHGGWWMLRIVGGDGLVQLDKLNWGTLRIRKLRRLSGRVKNMYFRESDQ